MKRGNIIIIFAIIFLLLISLTTAQTQEEEKGFLNNVIEFFTGALFTTNPGSGYGCGDGICNNNENQETCPEDCPLIPTYQSYQSVYACSGNDIVIQTPITCSPYECEYEASKPIASCGPCATCDPQALSAYTPSIQTEQTFTSESPSKISELFPEAGSILGFLDQISRPALRELLPISQGPLWALTQAGSLSVMQLVSQPKDAFAEGVHFVEFTGKIDPETGKSWCSFCNQIAPIVKEIQGMGYPLQVGFFEENQALAKGYNVGSLPTFLVIVDGKVVDRIEGGTTKERLIQMGERYKSEATKKSESERPSTGTRPRPPEEPPITPPQPPTLPPQPSTSILQHQDCIDSSGKILQDKKCECDESGTKQNYISDDGKVTSEEIIQTNVKIKIEDASGLEYGSGTIIDVREGYALIATAGHLFKHSGGKGTIEVDLSGTSNDDKLVGSLISYDLKSDIALFLMPLPKGVSITPAKFPPANYNSDIGDEVYSAGCPTANPCEIEKRTIESFNKFMGFPNTQVSGTSIVGCSGGGLFSKEGYFLGTCTGNYPSSNTPNAPFNKGTFTHGLRIIDELFRDKNNDGKPDLSFVYETMNPSNDCTCDKNGQCINKKTGEVQKEKPIKKPLVQPPIQVEPQPSVGNQVPPTEPEQPPIETSIISSELICSRDATEMRIREKICILSEIFCLPRVFSTTKTFKICGEGTCCLKTEKGAGCIEGTIYNGECVEGPDLDNDKIPDSLDLDIDGDGIRNEYDYDPRDKNEIRVLAKPRTEEIEIPPIQVVPPLDLPEKTTTPLPEGFIDIRDLPKVGCKPIIPPPKDCPTP